MRTLPCKGQFQSTVTLSRIILGGQVRDSRLSVPLAIIWLLGVVISLSAQAKDRAASNQRLAPRPSHHRARFQPLVTGKHSRAQPMRPRHRGSLKARNTQKRVAPTETAVPSQTYENDTRLLNQSYILHDKGMTELLSGSFDLAIKDLEQAIGCSHQYFGHPSIAEAPLYLDLGHAAELSGAMDQSKMAYMECLKRNPRSFQARLALVNLLLNDGLNQQAFQAAQRLLETNSADPRSHLLYGLTLTKSGHLRQGQSEVLRATQKQTINAAPKSRNADDTGPNDLNLVDPEPESGDGSP